jgi:hypothetical protein
MSCQMIRVISSPSSSTTGLATLILDMLLNSLHLQASPSPFWGSPATRLRAVIK